VEPADRAVVVHLEKRAKQLALAAARAASAKAALQRSPDVALLDESRLAGPDLAAGGHGFHDLPFLDLPFLDLPFLDFPFFGLPDVLRSGLRVFSRLSRLARPSRSFARRSLRVTPSRFLLGGMTCPSDTSSNRSAPAIGCASTRRTSTTSPRRCMAPL